MPDPTKLEVAISIRPLPTSASLCAASITQGTQALRPFTGAETPHSQDFHPTQPKSLKQLCKRLRPSASLCRETKHTPKRETHEHCLWRRRSLPGLRRLQGKGGKPHVLAPWLSPGDSPGGWWVGAGPGPNASLAPSTHRGGFLRACNAYVPSLPRRWPPSIMPVSHGRQGPRS